MASDYYAVLGINKNATMNEIKRAYRFLAQQLHPDKHQGENAYIAEKKLKELNEAYETLSDREKRKIYDNTSRTKTDKKPPSDSTKDKTLSRIEKYVELEQWDIAIAQCNKYLIKNPDDINAYFFRAVASCAKGDGIVRSPSNDKYSRELSMNTQNYYLDALDDYYRIIKLDSNNAIAFASHGLMNERLSDNMNYMLQTNKLSEAFINTITSNTGKNIHDVIKSYLNDAISNFKKAVQFEPNNIEYIENLQRLKNKYQQVENDLKTSEIVSNTFEITGLLFKALPTILLVIGIIWLIGKCS